MLLRHHCSSGGIQLVDTHYTTPTRITASANGQENPCGECWFFSSHAYIILPSIKSVITLFCSKTTVQVPSLSSYTPAQLQSWVFFLSCTQGCTQLLHKQNSCSSQCRGARKPSGTTRPLFLLTSVGLSSDTYQGKRQH